MDHNLELYSGEFDATTPVGLLIPDSYLICTFRIIAAMIHISSALYIYCDRNGLKINVFTRGTFKTLHLMHIQRFSPFTVWCWLIQCLYFTLVGLLSIAKILSPDSLKLFLPVSAVKLMVWILYEISFTSAYLVSIVVTYLLIPGLRLKFKGAEDEFFKFFPLLFHNANVILICIESILNYIPFSTWHFPFLILYGLTYVTFSWYWFKKTGVFYYFFLDYEMKAALLWHIGLIVVFLSFFYFGYYFSVMKLENNNLASCALALVTLLSLKLTRSP